MRAAGDPEVVQQTTALIRTVFLCREGTCCFARCSSCFMMLRNASPCQLLMTGVEKSVTCTNGRFMSMATCPGQMCKVSLLRPLSTRSVLQRSQKQSADVEPMSGARSSMLDTMSAKAVAQRSERLLDIVRIFFSNGPEQLWQGLLCQPMSGGGCMPALYLRRPAAQRLQCTLAQVPASSTDPSDALK